MVSSDVLRIPSCLRAVLSGLGAESGGPEVVSSGPVCTLDSRLELTPRSVLSAPFLCKAMRPVVQCPRTPRRLPEMSEIDDMQLLSLSRLSFGDLADTQ